VGKTVGAREPFSGLAGSRNWAIRKKKSKKVSLAPMKSPTSPTENLSSFDTLPILSRQMIANILAGMFGQVLRN
jgi:hypothetical protein